MRYTPLLLTVLSAVFLLTGCSDHRIPAASPTNISVVPLATGLLNPIGVDTDRQGRTWVTEAGTGKNDARVSLVTSDGKVYPAITGFFSETIAGGEVNGLNHLLFADGGLYVLGAHSQLYKVNVDNFKPGDAPISASSLPLLQDINTFVLNYPFVNNAHDSHLYNLVLGPDGALYFTDAGANAIIRRSKTGDLSVVTEVPGIPNPTPVGPPTVESVPTGITFNGTRFVISTLLGFPFPAGKAPVYQMDLTGKLTPYSQTFTSLVDVENDGSGGSVLLQYGVFGAMGFAKNTGQLNRLNGGTTTLLLDKLNQPTDLKIVDVHTAYLLSLGDGTLSKVTF